METIVVNVGLNVNRIEPKYQLDNSLLNLIARFDILDVRMANSAYKQIIDGKEEVIKERTLVVKMKGKKELSAIDVQEILSEVSANLKQERIAFVYSDTVGLLAYNPSFEGEKMNFNKDFFFNFNK